VKVHPCCMEPEGRLPGRFWQAFSWVFSGCPGRPGTETARGPFDIGLSGLDMLKAVN